MKKHKIFDKLVKCPVLDKLITFWYHKISNPFRDKLFEPIYYRFFGHKHHIIKTGLKPRSWYDTDTRLLYGIMETVKWFVDNDMRKWSKEDLEKEVERIKVDDSIPDGHKSDHIKGIQDQCERDDKIVAIADWWNNYQNRQDEISKALDDWHELCMKDVPDAHGMGFFKRHKYQTKEQLDQEQVLFDKQTELEKQLEKETIEKLHEVVDLMRAMWS